MLRLARTMISLGSRAWAEAVASRKAASGASEDRCMFLFDWWKWELGRLLNLSGKMAKNRAWRELEMKSSRMISIEGMIAATANALDGTGLLCFNARLNLARRPSRENP